MNEKLRAAWKSGIDPNDYEQHMASVGQAQANAAHVAEYFDCAGFPAGTRVLFAGAGTGQLFDFVAPQFLSPHKVTFADLNGAYLKKLSARLAVFPGLDFRAVVDDIEASKLPANFDLIVAVLILEHVNWRTAVATFCRLSSRAIFIVIQENPPESQAALTQTRLVVGTMNVFREVHPILVPKAELETEIARVGFKKNYCVEKEVLDGKKMIGLGFLREP